MIKKEIFINKKSREIEIIVEPIAESFILLSDQEAIIEFNFRNYSAPMTFQIWDDSIVIFEEEGVEIKIHINNVLVYSTDYS